MPLSRALIKQKDDQLGIWQASTSAFQLRFSYDNIRAAKGEKRSGGEGPSRFHKTEEMKVQR